MNHNDAHELLFLYHDGELPPPEREAVKAHVQACHDCQAALAEWTNTTKLLFPPHPLNTDAFVTRVMARLPKESAAGFVWWKTWWRMPVFAAAALLILLLGSPSTDRWGSADMSAADKKEPLEWLFGQDRDASEDVMGLVWEGV